MPEAWLGAAPPPSLAGLALGGWRLVEPGRARADLPWPGVAQARTPLVWYDTLAVRAEGGGAWSGFDGTLAETRGARVFGARGAHSVFSMASGDGGVDEYGLALSRGDSLRGLGVESMSGTSGAESGFESAGRHLWGAHSFLTRGRHHFAADFAQRGAAGQLADGREQSVSGQGGRLAWRWQRDGAEAGLAFERGWDRHQSFGGPLEFSQREAQESRWTAEGRTERPGRELAARLEWTDGAVRRFGDDAFTRRGRSLWGAVRTVQPLAGGRAELALGGGRHDGVDRFQLIPSAAYRVRTHGADATLRLERTVTPVWADLAPGQPAFAQRAWVGTLQAARADSQSLSVHGSLRAGRVYERALADRTPLEEVWLRRGLRPQLGTWDFALVEGGLAWHARHVTAGLEGFALAHRSSTDSVLAVEGGALARVPRADPDAGFRAWLGGTVRLFGGDLLLGLRGEVEGVGAREVGQDGVRRLDGYATCSAVADLSMGDATIVIRARHLEDHPREQEWIDTSTGLPALAGARDVGFRLVWRLFN